MKNPNYKYNTQVEHYSSMINSLVNNYDFTINKLITLLARLY